MLADLIDFTFQSGNPLADSSSIHFQLGLARPARSDTATKSREPVAAACQMRNIVVELSQFDLKLPFPGLGPTGKYVEDQPRTIDYLDLEQTLEVTHLRRAQPVIENNEIRIFGKNIITQFVSLPLADEKRSIRLRAVLDHFLDDASARRLGQFPQFVE